jgi:phage replication-related protein YjqB (UPF0714/DUF867 family)
MKRQEEYSNYAELEASEQEGRHFRRIPVPRPNAAVVVIAPHGGKIEPRTWPIAKRIAGTEFSVYGFIGRRKEIKGRKSLHIKSQNFDEPKCRRLVRMHTWVISIHGSGKKGKRVFLGGLDTQLVCDLTLALETVGICAENDGHNYRAAHPNNICNMGASKKGAQFELTEKFRNGNQLPSFIKAVRTVLLNRQCAA